LTQLEAARVGRVTEAMAHVAEKEGLPPEQIRERVPRGTRWPSPPTRSTLASSCAAWGKGNSKG
jgi:thiamine biosynthesis protein ThiC